MHYHLYRMFGSYEERVFTTLCVILLSAGLIAGTAPAMADASCPAGNQKHLGQMRYFSSVSYFNGDGYLFQAGSDGFSGDVRALKLVSQAGSTLMTSATSATANTQGSSSPIWHLSPVLRNQVARGGFDARRQVLTWNTAGNIGVPFRWPGNPVAPKVNGPSSSQINSLLQPYANRLNAADRNSLAHQLVNYWRGDQTLETRPSATGLNLKPRQKLLMPLTRDGLLVDAAATYSYSQGWPTGTFEKSAQSYSIFKQSLAQRNPMLYLVSDAGFLHGVEIKPTLQERFMYVPSGLFSWLGQYPLGLANPVPVAGNDGGYVGKMLTLGDALFRDQKWHRVLVAQTGEISPGLAALDITDVEGKVGGPVASENSAQRFVLWERSRRNGLEYGARSGVGTIARLHNGHWGLLVASGYNDKLQHRASPIFKASLLVLDLQTGKTIKTITLPGQTSASTADIGLSEPGVVDLDGDHIVDYAFAGDHQGNLWKFDLTSSNEQRWHIESSSLRSSPMFIAKDIRGQRQAIWSKPIVTLQAASNSSASNILVYFAAGHKNQSGHVNSSIYALKVASGIKSRKGLLQQPYRLSGTNGVLSWMPLLAGGKAVQNPSSVFLSKGWVADFAVSASGSSHIFSVRSIALNGARLQVLGRMSDGCGSSSSSLVVNLLASNGEPADYSVGLPHSGTVTAPASSGHSVIPAQSAADTVSLLVKDDPANGERVLIATQGDGSVVETRESAPEIKLRRLQWRALVQ